MFCTRCGTDLRERDKFCPDCGTPTTKLPLAQPTVNTTRLSRSSYDKKIAGVCAGIARYLTLDPTLVRIIAVILLFWPIPGMASIAYLVAWIVMPQDALALPAGARQSAQIV